MAGTGNNGDPEESISDYDFILIKYTAGGTKEWVAREENYRTISNRLTAMTLGVDGHIYLTGQTSKLTEIVTDVDYNILYSDADYLTIKYDPEGKLVWEQRYNGTGDSTDIAYSVAVDDAGNVYVAGISDGDTLKNEVTIVKYDAGGAQLWVKKTGVVADSNPLYYRRFSSESGGFLRLDTSSNIYITTSSNHKILTMKYDTSGKKIWQTQSGVLSAPTVIALDDNNNLYVAGATLSEVTGYQETYYQPEDYLTIKYSQGAIACDKPVRVNLYLPPHAIKVGEPIKTTAIFPNQVITAADAVRWSWGDNSTFNAYISNTTRVTGKHTYQEAGIYKIGLNLSNSCLRADNENYQQWMVIYDPNAGIVTGAGQIDSPQRSYPLMKTAGKAQFAFHVSYRTKNSFTPQGQTLYNLQSLGSFRSCSLAWLVIKQNQAIWLGEGTINGKGNYGFIASVIDAGGKSKNDTGDRLRISIWNKDKGNAIVYDNFPEAGDIYDLTTTQPAIGKGQIIINPRNVLTATSVYLNQIAVPEPSHFYNYPNTFSDKTTLSFTMQQEGDFELEVLDMKGRSVKKISAGKVQLGQVYEYEFDGSQLEPGIYIARLINGKSTQSIKMMLRR
ncbi:SBBP repeat-containing protein [Pontibacter vulgaris]|uniref:SBBP repeat-containing protein n=1 Tax=Pontibacter vulgaris TaxID=2905679 RepID=UPI001FA7F241